VLSVADDLDAFGYTGIFRYSEIYLERKISFREIGIRIRENARNRFENFEKHFIFSDDLYLLHKLKYEILDNFFKSYNDTLDSYDFKNLKPFGYCGVIHLFSNITKERIMLNEFILDHNNYSYDRVMNWYFKGLISEMET